MASGKEQADGRWIITVPVEAARFKGSKGRPSVLGFGLGGECEEGDEFSGDNVLEIDEVDIVRDLVEQVAQATRNGFRITAVELNYDPADEGSEAIMLRLKERLTEVLGKDSGLRFLG